MTAAAREADLAFKAKRDQAISDALNGMRAAGLTVVMPDQLDGASFKAAILANGMPNITDPGWQKLYNETRQYIERIGSSKGVALANAVHRSGQTAQAAWLEYVDMAAAVVVVAALVGELLLVVVNMLLRATVSINFTWSDEASRLALTVMTFIGGAFAYRPANTWQLPRSWSEYPRRVASGC